MVVVSGDIVPLEVLESVSKSFGILLANKENFCTKHHQPQHIRQKSFFSSSNLVPIPISHIMQMEISDSDKKKLM
ncbi:hypothetical protein CR513_10169, partial [Mucuna pruriens]